MAKEVPNDPNVLDLYEFSILSLGVAVLLQVFSMLPFTDRSFTKPKKPFSGNPLFFEDVADSTLETFQKQFVEAENQTITGMVEHISAQAHVYASIASRKFRLFRISMVFFTVGIFTAVLALCGI